MHLEFELLLTPYTLDVLSRRSPLMTGPLDCYLFAIPNSSRSLSTSEYLLGVPT